VKRVSRTEVKDACPLRSAENVAARADGLTASTQLIWAHDALRWGVFGKMTNGEIQMTKSQDRAVLTFDIRQFFVIRHSSFDICIYDRAVVGSRARNAERGGLLAGPAAGMVLVDGTMGAAAMPGRWPKHRDKGC